MMHGHEKSRSAIVAVKPTNKAATVEAEETRTSKARTGHRTGQPCHRRWSAYGKFAVTHPRREPCAGIPLARFWAGGGQ